MRYEWNRGIDLMKYYDITTKLKRAQGVQILAEQITASLTCETAANGLTTKPMIS